MSLTHPVSSLIQRQNFENLDNVSPLSSDSQYEQKKFWSFFKVKEIVLNLLFHCVYHLDNLGIVKLR